MISISNISKCLALCLCVLLVPAFSSAQGEISQTLSVSPTLFEMKGERGQAWTSVVRVINVNDYAMTVYPQAVNFEPLGEDGRGDLIPIITEETQGQTLAEWITVPSDPVVIPAQATAEVPIQVNIPDDAAPGGHYAAIMVGTRPPVETSNESQVQTAQFVTSLFFVRIAGDVIEAGDIREFTTNTRVVQDPEIELLMRFENTGNVHVQPQGDIKIFNMWGKERGIIPINHQTHFGNVLPSSIRKFSFTWKGDTSLYDIGRYRAVATLGYGDDGKKFVTSTTYFWVIPYTTIALSLIVLFVTLKIGLWMIRRYIERMLALSGINPQQAPYVPHAERQYKPSSKTVVISRYGQVTAPVRASLSEIIAGWRDAIGISAKMQSIVVYVRKHIRVIAAIVLLVIDVTLIVIAVQGITKERSHYNVSINNSGANVTLSSEDIAYETLRLQASKPAVEQKNVKPIMIVNSSGVVGAGAHVRFMLEQQGFVIDRVTVAEDRTDARTVIVYPPADQELAVALSRELAGALISAQTGEAEEEIIIYAGKDNVPQ